MNTEIGHAILFGLVACVFAAVSIAGFVQKKISFGSPGRGAEIHLKEKPVQFWIVQCLVIVSATLPALISVGLWLRIVQK